MRPSRVGTRAFSPKDWCLSRAHARISPKHPFLSRAHARSGRRSTFKLRMHARSGRKNACAGARNARLPPKAKRERQKRRQSHALTPRLFPSFVLGYEKEPHVARKLGEHLSTNPTRRPWFGSLSHNGARDRIFVPAGNHGCDPRAFCPYCAPVTRIPPIPPPPTPPTP